MRKILSVLLFLLILTAQSISPDQILNSKNLSRDDVQKILQQTGQPIPTGQLNNPLDQRASALSDLNKELTIQANEAGIDSLIEKDILTEDFFGQKFFRSFKLTPNTYGPVPDTYILGTGDEIIVTLYGEVQLEHALIIDRNGSITPKDVGRIKLASTTFSDAKKIVRNAYSNFHRSIKQGKTSVYMTIGKQRRVQVNVLGTVHFPQNINLSALNSLFDAIVMAGGPTKDAALRNVKIIRANQILEYDLYQYLVPGLKKFEVPKLENGDIIVLGREKKEISIDGHVRHPGKYETSSKSTIEEIVKVAGGLLPGSTIENSTIFSVHGEKISAVRNENYFLQSGDSIYIMKPTITDTSFVEIKGSVLYPGRYSFKKNMKLVELVKIAGGYLNNTFFSKIDIRRKVNRKESQSLTISEEKIADFILKEDDVVRIYNKNDFIDERKLYIYSYAQGNFEYPYEKNITVTNLLRRIGGIKYIEDDSSVEIVRITQKSENEYAKLFPIDIDDSYLDSTNGFELLPDDILIIRRNPKIEDFKTVNISGEVVSAGTYPIIKYNDTLYDLLGRAKGLKKSAYLDGAEYYRIVGDDTVRVPVDFKKVLKNRSSSDNIVLKDRDRIVIPTNSNVVIVSGEVLTPTAVLFKEGASVEYYISQAGGISEFGDESRVQVIKANGKHLEYGFFSGDKVTAGTKIHVPSQVRKKEEETKEIIQTIFGYLSTLMTTLVIFRRL
jgi:protein involved in polysaccharide export with SLBB domain